MADHRANAAWEVRPEVVTGSPPPRRVCGLSAGMNRAADTGWERPPTGSRRACVSPDCGAVDRTIGGGSLPAPFSVPEQSVDSGVRDRNATGPTGLGKHRGANGVAEVVAEGGVVFRYCESGPKATPRKVNYSADSGVTSLTAFPHVAFPGLHRARPSSDTRLAALEAAVPV